MFSIASIAGRVGGLTCDKSSGLIHCYFVIAKCQGGGGKLDTHTTHTKKIVIRVEADRFEKKDQIAALEAQQAIKKSQIDYAMNFMHDAYKLWLDANVDLRQKFQKAIFPEGVVLDTKSLKFGTQTISPLYRYISNKKDLSVSEKSLLVTSRGIEPRLPG